MSVEKRVLFVDDSPEFLDMTQQIISGIAGDRWEVYTAQNVGQAMNIIAEKQIDLVVVDVHMPVVDGMQFLTLLNRKHPNVLKAVLTADTSDTHRTVCMSRGAELFLGKPQSQAEWEKIFTSLDALGRFQPTDEGFRGVLRRVGLQDVLQMECLSRNSVMLEITTKELRGHIYILEGQIVHAEAGDRSGPEAFNFLMGLTGGEFAQKPFNPPAVRSITDSWEFLLMEAARKRDELSGEGEPEALEETIMPPLHYSSPQAATAPEPRNGTARQAEQPSDWGDTPLHQIGGVRPMSPAQRRAFVPPPPESQTHFFTRPPVPNSVDAHRPDVAEFIIVSSQGDLLYEWQCHDVNARVSFLEFLSQKARLLCQGLPMGHFERFEVFGSKSRILTQMENDHAVFVRSNVATDTSVVEDNS